MLNLVYQTENRMWMVDAYYFGRRLRKTFRDKTRAERFKEAVALSERKLTEAEEVFFNELGAMFK